MRNAISSILLLLSAVAWCFFVGESETTDRSYLSPAGLAAAPSSPLFKMLFPRSGDNFLLSRCSFSRCFCSMHLVIAVEPKTPLDDYIMLVHFHDFENLHNDFDEETLYLISVVYETLIPEDCISFMFNVSILQVSTGDIVFHSSTVHPTVHSSDIGTSISLGLDQRSTERPAMIDFIEIGTSNFDTCTQQAKKLLDDGTVSHSIRGTAVDVVLPYLQELPTFPGLTKIHAAITADPNIDMVSVFSIPQSVIRKV
jgi:hypothetical protein